MNYKEYLDIAKKTAIKAGDFLIKNKLNKKVVLTEEGRDIKLELDRETENLIRKELEKTNIIILGEEFGGEISSKSLRWVIDPIDGTANYFRGLDQCCVSIALMDQDKSKLGIVYNFNNGEIYSAAEGLGCYLNDSKINVSDIDQKNKASITTGFPASETIDSQYEFLDELQGWKKIRMFGSAALSCAYIASGKCDYYAEKGVYLWDFAAGICLVEEAGGNAEYSLIDDERYAVRFSNGKL
tara:strand:+ start:5786 stop:6508 length:723 start_codon:yes stop_codon:yes gene_type:complete